jgi:hypothetical protein
MQFEPGRRLSVIGLFTGKDPLDLYAVNLTNQAFPGIKYSCADGQPDAAKIYRNPISCRIAPGLGLNSCVVDTLEWPAVAQCGIGFSVAAAFSRPDALKAALAPKGRAPLFDEKKKLSTVQCRMGPSPNVRSF